MRPAARRSIHRALPIALFTLSVIAVSTGARAEEPGVLIALDSSRSLSAEQSRAAAELARDLVSRLGATSPPAVLTFDDSVHWLARPGAAAAQDVNTALDALMPTGRYTVLYDGLIEGVRELGDGGVVVLISDGKDENSATTLEDIARLASERGVRVVSLGAGRVDERTMKRLAILTEGDYAGVASSADPSALASKVESLLRDIRAAKAAAAPPPPAAAPAAPAPVTAAPAPAPARESSRPLLLVGALVAAAGIVLGFLLARRRSAAEPEDVYEPDAGTKPGVPVPEAPASQVPAATPVPAPEPQPESEPIPAAQLVRLRTKPAVATGGLMEISLDDTAAFQRLSFSESLERTLVIQEEVVLTVRAPGQEPRTFRLPPGRAIDVGRDAKRNTLAFQDPTMSVQHFRLVLDEGEVFLVDLGSTNGVLYRQRRVQSARLDPGDRFRAGMFEFELNLHRASAA